MPADDLAPPGARSSAGMVKTKLRSCMYMGPALVGYLLMCYQGVYTIHITSALSAAAKPVTC